MNDGSADHSDALLREAAHRLADTIAPYRVLQRGTLADLSGISHWTTVGFDQAPSWAVDHDFLRRLDDNSTRSVQGPTGATTGAGWWRAVGDRL
jgi:hypothetical protein